MTKIEPMPEQLKVPEIIKTTDVNGEIEVHADRLASFKTSLSRLNSKLPKKQKLLFSYSKLIGEYYIAKRIA